jgi:cytochrome c oxidase subunit 3
VSDLVTSEEEQPPVVGLPPSSRSTAQFGVIVFLASDVMLFAPFFAAYFLLRADNQPWPPDGVDLDVHRAGERPGGARAMRNWLLVTIVLGAVFVTNQLLEYRALDFAADTPYGSIYYLVTGLHGLHVTVGIAAMALLFVRAVRAADRHDVATWAGGVSLFWHLVDVIWVFVFSMIWLLQ